MLVDPPVAMAPMADVTDVHFHEMLAEIGGPGLYTAEMVSSTALDRRDPWALRLLRRPAGCPAFAVQVYGADPELMARAAVEAVENGADLVDINMGCPAKTITGRACGSALLRDLPLVASIFRAVRRALPDDVPLTVKLRTGWDERRLNYLDVGRLAVDEGLAAVTLHGRTRAQMFEGESDWTAIAALARVLPVPVVGNGDVRSASDALRLLRETGASGVMIARAALANPWIFRDVRDLLAGRTPREPDLAERRRVILAHHERLSAALPEGTALHRIRKFVGFYTRGLRDGAGLRRRLGTFRDAASFRAGVDDFFAELDGGAGSSSASAA